MDVGGGEFYRCEIGRARFGQLCGAGYLMFETVGEMRENVLRDMNKHVHGLALKRVRSLAKTRSALMIWRSR